MNNPIFHSTHGRRNQTGMTLIELLVALTIGLFIIGAALMVFQNVSGVGRQISELTELRQEGAFAFRTIGKQIQEAGSVEPSYSVDNFKFRFNKPVWEAATATPIGSWTPPLGTDFLSISQQVQTNSEYAKFLRNCLGEEVTNTNRESNFYIKDDNLMCVTGSNINGQPVIKNVNAFRVRYRVRPNDSDRQFVDTPTDWTIVDGVEICIDLIGTKPTPTASNTYTDCDGNNVSLGNRLHVVQNNLFTVFTAQR